MRKIICLIINVFLMTCAVTVNAEADKISPVETDFGINLNDCDITLWIRKPIYSIDDTIYVPVRDVADFLGMDIQWEDYSKTIFISRNSEKIFPYKADNGMWGYTNLYGETVVEPIYYSASTMTEGLAEVETSGSMKRGAGYINKNGEIIIPYIYDYASSFQDGLAMVSKNMIGSDDIPVQFINKQGEIVLDNNFNLRDIGHFSNGYTKAVRERKGLYEIKWSFMDKSGAWVNDMEFDDTSGFKYGYAYVKKDNKWAVIDKDFNFITDYQYGSQTEAEKAFNTFKSEFANFKFVVDGKNMEDITSILVLNDTTYLSAQDIGKITGLNADFRIGRDTLRLNTI